ncbi:MAG: sugar transporter substrate-binding protein [Lachnospiraceae bacterium]|nr:sugar transporter substrate-binding protein [Lachnospiraceae bacterium]
MKKLFKVTMIGIMACLLLVGCGSKKANNESEKPDQQGNNSQTEDQDATTGDQDATTEEEVTISFWDGNWQEAVWPEVQAIWEKEHPNIKVEAEFQADLANDKYMLALTNGTAPDVLSCALDWTTTFGSAELLAPLDTFITDDGLDVGQYVQGAINASTVNGNLYALPFRSETYVLFYNKDLLAAAGYTEAPKTWEEVKEIAAATTKDDVYGYGVTGANYGNFSFQYITMLRSSGGTILSQDVSKSELASPVAIQTAQLYKDLAQYAPASMLENDNVANRTLFASGKVAMYMSGIYDVEEILKVNPDLNFACAMVPTANDAERSSILGGWSVAVAESSKEKEAAWEFVKFLTRPDVAAIYTNTFTGTGDIAARYANLSTEIIEPNAEALTYAKALPVVKNIVGIREAIFDNLQLMLSDGKSAEEACATLEQATNDLLK